MLRARVRWPWWIRRWPDMKQIVPVFIVSSIALAVVSSAQENTNAPPSMAGTSIGRSLFMKNCAHCHLALMRTAMKAPTFTPWIGPTSDHQPHPQRQGRPDDRLSRSFLPATARFPRCLPPFPQVILFVGECKRLNQSPGHFANPKILLRYSFSRWRRPGCRTDFKNVLPFKSNPESKS